MTPLGGRGIVITRPAGEAGRLAQLVREAGGVPLLHPAIELLDAPDPATLDALIDRLDQFDLAIFISPSAVTKAMARITGRRALPPGLRLATIGPGGVRAFARYGVRDVIHPEGRADSEALLDTAALKSVNGQQVVIFRGDGGRELLGDTLRARGAVVEYAACYRRGKPALDAAALERDAHAGRIGAVVFTSSEGVRNFCEALSESGDSGIEWLRKTPVVVPHPRIADAASQWGLRQVVVSAAGDEAMLLSLIACFKTP